MNTQNIRISPQLGSVLFFTELISEHCPSLPDVILLRSSISHLVCLVNGKRADYFMIENLMKKDIR